MVDSPKFGKPNRAASEIPLIAKFEQLHQPPLSNPIELKPQNRAARHFGITEATRYISITQPKEIPRRRGLSNLQPSVCTMASFRKLLSAAPPHRTVPSSSSSSFAASSSAAASLCATAMPLLRPLLSHSSTSTPRLSPSPPSSARPFSSSPPLAAKSSTARLLALHASVPAYPFGASTTYKQSNFGLYGLARLRSGNMVSAKNAVKTRRAWRPNVQRRRLWSAALRRHVRVRVAARVVRTIDKVGGLDEYLLGGKSARLRELGMEGWRLRWRIVQTEAVRQRWAGERLALGLVGETTEGEMLMAAAAADGGVAGGASGGLGVGITGQPTTQAQLEEEIKAYDSELDKEVEIDLEDLVGRVEERSK